MGRGFEGKLLFLGVNRIQIIYIHITYINGHIFMCLYKLVIYVELHSYTK